MCREEEEDNDEGDMASRVFVADGIFEGEEVSGMDKDRMEEEEEEREERGEEDELAGAEVEISDREDDNEVVVVMIVDDTDVGSFVARGDNFRCPE